MSQDIAEVNVVVEGGKATPGPPLAPAIGPLGINLMQVVQEINNKTKSYAGLKIPVKIIVNKKKRSFEIEVGSPPTAALIKLKTGITKGAPTPGTVVCGSIEMNQVIEIAKEKQVDMFVRGLKEATLDVLGTVLSMGMECEGRSPRDWQKEIKDGQHDSLFT